MNNVAISRFRAPDPRREAPSGGPREKLAKRGVRALSDVELLALILGRWRVGFPIAVILVAMVRSMALQSPDFEVQFASLVIGAGLLYLALKIIRRPSFFPIMTLIGLTLPRIRGKWQIQIARR